MKIALMTILCLGVCLFFPGCAEKQNKAMEQNPAEQIIPPAQPFVPPPDSTISRPQMTAWFASNPGLDSLSVQFTRTLQPANAPGDSAKKLFALTQDHICVKNGLISGYAEYRWITENVGNARNKALFDSLKAKTAGG